MRVERIKTELRNAANSFVNAGIDLREALAKSNRPKLTEWAEELDAA